MNLRTVATLLASMLALSACAGADPAPAAPAVKPGAVRLRVMTYNMNFGVAGDQAGVDAIALASPDLVMLQETNAEWEAALVAGLGTRFPHHRFAPPHNEWVAGGMGVMSRWPIKHIETLTGGGGPFFAWRIIVEAPGGPMQILNLHLRPPMSDSGSWVVGYFTTRANREREARSHVAALDPALPTIVVGDLNEEDEGRAIAVFRKRGFETVLAQFHPNVDTWQWPVGSMTLRFRLDHILVDKHFDALDAGVVKAGRSDHAPVWADLTRR